MNFETVHPDDDCSVCANVIARRRDFRDNNMFAG